MVMTLHSVSRIVANNYRFGCFSWKVGILPVFWIVLTESQVKIKRVEYQEKTQLL